MPLLCQEDFGFPLLAVYLASPREAGALGMSTVPAATHAP